MAMKTVESISQRKKYPMRLILDVADYSSAAWYGNSASAIRHTKPGPKPIISDDILLKEIRDEIKNSLFNGEGYKKVHARMTHRGVKASHTRVLQIMRKNNLLAPVRPKSNGSSRPHDGKITTDIPNKMWGTDGKQFYTQEDGWCWMFSVIDHCNDEILGHHEVKKGNRFAAMEPLREAVRKEYGATGEGVCRGAGLFLRADHGSQYDSNDFQREIKFLGLEYSPAFVRSPECNGIIERFHRTIEEQVFSVCQFKNLKEASVMISEFIEKYNNHWIIQRLKYLSPIDYKKKLYLQKKLQKSA